MRRSTDDFYGIDWRRAGIFPAVGVRGTRKDLQRPNEIEDLGPRTRYEDDTPRRASRAAIISIVRRRPQLLNNLTPQHSRSLACEFLGSGVEGFLVVVAAEIILLPFKNRLRRDLWINIHSANRAKRMLGSGD